METCGVCIRAWGTGVATGCDRSLPSGWSENGNDEDEDEDEDRVRKRGSEEACLAHLASAVTEGPGDLGMRAGAESGDEQEGENEGEDEEVCGVWTWQWVRQYLEQNVS